jgi:hypothetical protein
VAVGIAISQWLRRPEDPDEVERVRRARLNQVGRIVEGHVIELVEVTPESPAADRGAAWRGRRRQGGVPNGRRKMVCYSYSISGVSYETAQDVTGLQERASLDRLIAGQPASIKFDPSNPSDSILIAEDWSGIR